VFKFILFIEKDPNKPLQNKKPVLNELNKLAVSSFTCKSAFIPSKITPNEYITPSRIKLIN
jgi:hypothetical protein